MDLFLHPDSLFHSGNYLSHMKSGEAGNSIDFIIWQLVEKILSLLLAIQLIKNTFSSVIERIQVVKRLWTENFGLWVCHCFSLSGPVLSLSLSSFFEYILFFMLFFDHGHSVSKNAFSSVIFHPRWPYTLISPAVFHVFQGFQTVH